jgi:lipopolysaccharide export system permease protein
LKLITRYLLREHVGPLLFAVSTLTSLLLLNYIAKRFDQLVGKDLPWGVIAEFFALSIPFTMAMTLPMAVLMSTLYAFSRLAADSEITALMASGIGARQLLRPVIGAGLLFSIGMILFNDQILPRANYRLNKLSASISQKKPTLALREQVINEVSPGRTYLRMSRLDPRRNRMYEVVIYDLAATSTRRTIVADSGDLAFASNQRDLLLTLYDGYVQEMQPLLPERYQRIGFTQDIMRVQDVANDLTRSEDDGYKGDREMGICELQEVIDREAGRRDAARVRLAALDSATPLAGPYARSRLGAWYCRLTTLLSPVATAEAQDVRIASGDSTVVGGAIVPDSLLPAPSDLLPTPPTSVPTAMGAASVERRGVELEIERAEGRMAEFAVEIHKKFSIALACLIFALLGPPIALRFPRGGVGLTIGVSLGVFALYYVGLIAGEPLADSRKVPPGIAMWGANAVIGVVAVILAWRMGQAGATARGGDLGELWDRIIPARFRRRA